MPPHIAVRRELPTQHNIPTFTQVIKQNLIAFTAVAAVHTGKNFKTAFASERL
jgi:hypothetical protein